MGLLKPGYCLLWGEFFLVVLLNKQFSCVLNLKGQHICSTLCTWWFVLWSVNVGSFLTGWTTVSLSIKMWLCGISYMLHCHFPIQIFFSGRLPAFYVPLNTLKNLSQLALSSHMTQISFHQTTLLKIQELRQDVCWQKVSKFSHHVIAGITVPTKFLPICKTFIDIIWNCLLFRSIVWIIKCFTSTTNLHFKTWKNFTILQTNVGYV